MGYIDSEVKSIDENKTIGIIIVKENNQFLLKYISDDKILTREYKIVTL